MLRFTHAWLGFTKAWLLSVTSPRHQTLFTRYILEMEFGICMPRQLQIEYSSVMQTVSDVLAREIQPKEIFSVFKKVYLWTREPIELTSYKIEKEDSSDTVTVQTAMSIDGNALNANGTGNGPVAAFVAALNTLLDEPRRVEVP